MQLTQTYEIIMIFFFIRYCNYVANETFREYSVLPDMKYKKKIIYKKVLSFCFLLNQSKRANAHR